MRASGGGADAALGAETSSSVAAIAGVSLGLSPELVTS
jgi:hypothetical protein